MKFSNPKCKKQSLQIFKLLTNWISESNPPTDPRVECTDRTHTPGTAPFQPRRYNSSTWRRHSRQLGCRETTSRKVAYCRETQIHSWERAWSSLNWRRKARVRHKWENVFLLRYKLLNEGFAVERRREKSTAFASTSRFRESLLLVRGLALCTWLVPDPTSDDGWGQL